MKSWAHNNGLMVLASLLTLTLVISCSQNDTRQDSRISWERIESSALNDREHDLFRRAEEARGDLAGTLMGRVTEVLSDKGPAKAVEVCNLEAQGLTREVAERHNVDIGRTSFRLRNPDNQPPKWARQLNLIENRVDEQVILKKGSDQLAVLTPIHLEEKCATCHGPKNELSPRLREVLTKRYPDDEATGFEPGDLRGWFWVEVPGSLSIPNGAHQNP